MQLSEHLETNLTALNARLGSSADFYAKRIELYRCRGAILLFDGMASLESLWELLLDAASRQTPPLLSGQAAPGGERVYQLLWEHSALPAESAPVEGWESLMQRLTAGMAVLLLDGCAKGIAFSVQSLKYRSVEEPSGEGNIRGSREGFCDLLRINLSLLRRLIRTPDLVQEVPVALSSEASYVSTHAAEDISCLLPDNVEPDMLERTVTLTNDTVDAPVSAGDVLGKLTLFYNGKVYAETDLLALNDVSASWFLTAQRRVSDFFAKPLVRILLIVVVLLIAALVVYVTMFSRRRRYGHRRRGRAGSGYRGRRRRF